MDKADKKRNTGRTSRMLDAIRERVNNGELVVVVMLPGHWSDARRCFTPLQLQSIMAIVPDQFDFTNWRYPGAAIGAVVFVDHAVISRRYSDVLAELTRWDEEKTKCAVCNNTHFVSVGPFVSNRKCPACGG